MSKKTKNPTAQTAENYRHEENEAILRPDAGLQAQFNKKRMPKTYRYDSSLAPEISWDINADREKVETLVAKLRTSRNIEEVHYIADQLKAMSSPFLNWAGKAENTEFTVPTLPLFVHERLSTKAILESVKKRQAQINLFADPELSIAERLSAYEHKTGWVNRLILGDNLQVMNSLLEYEGLGGQVQMIYMDPPYGVKFGSNFQPFIRKRDVGHNDDKDFTREPEMVQAYRDTWEVGLHSYLTYLRDRFKLAKDLLHPSGSLFMQISDENVHHVREILDEVFGANNFCASITFEKTRGQSSYRLSSVYDNILWYSKNIELVKYRQIFIGKEYGKEGTSQYVYVESPDGEISRRMTKEEITNPLLIPKNWKIYSASPMVSESASGNPPAIFEFQGDSYSIKKGSWKTNQQGFERLKEAGRIMTIGNTLMFKRYYEDFPFNIVTNQWQDTFMTGFSEAKLYVVQTSIKTIERCLMMTTDPGDLEI